MREIIKAFFEKISNKIKSSPGYVRLLLVRDKVAAYVLKALLALFNAIGPIWNFFFLKTQDADLKRTGVS